MNKLIKSLGLMFPLVGLVGCGASSGDGVNATYKYASYTMTYTTGGASELDNYLSLLDLSKEEDIAKKMDLQLTSYYEGDRTPDEAIHFTSDGGISEPFKDGSTGTEYNANVHKIDEYSSSIGFLYGKVNGTYHIYTRYSSYLDHKRYFDRTITSSSTRRSTLYDENIEFNGSTLLVKAKGTFTVDEAKTLEFLITLTYNKI